MFQDYQFTVKERLIKYVQIDTQSDPRSDTTPSTEKQKDLSRLLVEELKELGIADAELDHYGYVYATLPSNTDKQVPVICLCAHVDTAPDCSGTGVKPIVHEKYDGSDIVLPDDTTQVISIADHPYLREKIGEDIVTASGNTLLGADDKAGVAIIMDLLRFLQMHPEVKHGTVRILFTPDEEVGKGVNKLDMKKLAADYGYTLDGGERGSLEDENFSADGVHIVFHGISAHPGSAKGKLVNALKVAAAFIDSLPKDEWSPETTEDRYGFVHPVRMEGNAEKATVDFIVRDFITAKLTAYENSLKDKVQDALLAFPGARAEFTVQEQYRNMKEVLDQHPQVVSLAQEAMNMAGCTVKTAGIRGGTDGARLSFMGLPCPNLFTGEMALHGKHEYVSVQDMQKSVESLVYLLQLWEQKAVAG
ncbi:MAG TPA: peptidase T [Chitinophagaceae bacterium]|nr:peptidase T [Chitinophagaceae bacterium]